MKRILTTVAATVLAVGLAAVPAAAATGTTSEPRAGAGTDALVVPGGRVAPSPTATADRLPELQARGKAAIDRRLASLSSASARLTASAGLSDAHRSALLSAMSADSAGLTALGSALAADTTAAEAKGHVQQVVTDFRVYAVVLPQAGIVRGADRLTTTALPKLAKAHDALAAEGKDAAQLATMQQHLDAADAAVAGLADAALAVTPAGYNANHAVLTPLRSRLRQAIAESREALAIARSLSGGAA